MWKWWEMLATVDLIDKWPHQGFLLGWSACIRICNAHPHSVGLVAQFSTVMHALVLVKTRAQCGVPIPNSLVGGSLL